MKIVVFGGTGFVGRKLIDDLLKNGHEIMVVSRNAGKSKNIFSNDVAHIEWDYSTDLVPSGMEDAEAIINLAGVSIAGKKWTKEIKEAILNSRINATRAIVLSIKKKVLNPKVLVNASAAGYYGDGGDEKKTEESAPGDDFLATVSKKWEHEALKAKELGVRVVLIRTGLVLGDGGVLEKMALPYKFFVGGRLASGKQWFTWVHIDDIVNIYSFVVENDQISGPVNSSSPEPIRNKDLNKILGKVLKRPSFFIIPAFAIRLVMGEMGDVVLHGQRAIPQKLIDHGFTYEYPKIRPALEEIFNR